LTGRARFATTAAMSLSVVPIDHLELTFVPWSWPFAQERRGAIDAHFAERRARRPQLFNGRVILSRGCQVADRRLAGTCFETDFASFLAWRDWGFPDSAITNCFAMGVLTGSDGALLLGVMGAHTANAGAIYFPAGTPDPSDLVDGRLDLASSIAREVAEETGLATRDYAAEPGWHAVVAGPRLALMKQLSAPRPAVDLQRRIREYIAREAVPELADVRIVRGPGDLDPAMPPFVAAYLDHWFRRPPP
jgi:8-oxo-dGTP pyrophosphatase MutT (NUDIX family)